MFEGVRFNIYVECNKASDVKADIIWVMFDLSRTPTFCAARDIIKEYKGAKVILLGNKADIRSQPSVFDIRKLIEFSEIRKYF